MVVGMDWFIENTLLRAKKQAENFFVIKIIILDPCKLILDPCKLFKTNNLVMGLNI